MAKHHPDLVMCRKQPGVAIGRLCEKCESCWHAWVFVPFSFAGSSEPQIYLPVLSLLHSLSHTPCLLVLHPPPHSSPGDGKCVICDSFVRPCNLVHICDECNYGSFEGRCVVCGGVGVSDAYYCRECVQQEKDRDGCPKIVNLGSTKTDLFYERKKYGFKKR